MSSRPYPPDVDPQSQCRLPLPRRDELDAEGQRIYDSLADPRGGSLRGLRGPGGIHLHSPVLARHTRALNGYLRQEAELGGRLRELAILVTARELGRTPCNCPSWVVCTSADSPVRATRPRIPTPSGMRLPKA